MSAAEASLRRHSAFMTESWRSVRPSVCTTTSVVHDARAVNYECSCKALRWWQEANAGAASRVLQSPVAQCFDDRPEALALLRQLVLEPGRVLAVLLARDQAARFHGFQARGQGV